MKLRECYIVNFGKISEKKITFSDGLNSFVQENGWGKTTLTAFIRAMLFGLSDSKKTDLDENERKHYLPWNNGVCGGRLTFEAGGKLYRIERTFGQKPSQDTFALYDADTGNESSDFSETPGRDLFKIDKDGFERTVFLSDRNLSGKNTNKTISEKLSDLSGVVGDIGVMDDALKLLDSRRKYYYKKGGDGEIANAEAEYKRAELALERLEGTRRALGEAEGKLSALEGERLALLEEEKSRIEYEKRMLEVNRQSVIAEHYMKRSAELSEKRKRLSEITAFFGTDIPTVYEIDAMSYDLKVAEAAIRKAPPTKSERLSELEEILSSGEKKKAKRGFFAKILSIFALLFSAIRNIFGGGRKAKASPERIEYEALLGEYERELKAHKDSTDAAAEKIKLINERISKYPTVSEHKLEGLRALVKEKDGIEDIIKILTDEIAAYSGSGSPTEIITTSARSHEEIARNIAEVAENIRRTKSEIASYTYELDTEDSLIEKRDNARLTADTYVKNYETVIKARSFLEKARDNMTARYLGKTKSAFEKYLRLIGIEADDFELNTDFEVKKYDSGLLRSAEAYSTGTKDLFYLAIRLALIDSLYEDEEPFLIFDDPLAALDDKKSDSVKRVLKAISAERQVLYFTCSASRSV